MIDRIKNLIGRGLFGSTQLNKLGHGTFLAKAKTEAPTASTHLEKARVLKKEADSTFASARGLGSKMYMEALFCYIRGYLEEERGSAVRSIYSWKGLAKFVGSVVGLFGKEEEEQASIFRLALFNIKFHYLHLESSIMTRQLKQIREKDRTQLLYFLKELGSLYETFESSGQKEFSVVKLDDLEQFIRNRAEFVE
jgi:hypothetical protein